MSNINNRDYINNYLRNKSRIKCENEANNIATPDYIFEYKYSNTINIIENRMIEYLDNMGISSYLLNNAKKGELLELAKNYSTAFYHLDDNYLQSIKNIYKNMNSDDEKNSDSD